MDVERTVLVCQYVNCCKNGSASVLETFLEQPIAGVTVIGSDCQGQCNMGPTVRVLPDETWYCRVQSGDVSEIVEQHLKQNKPVDRLLHPRLHRQFGSPLS